MKKPSSVLFFFLIITFLLAAAVCIQSDPLPIRETVTDADGNVVESNQQYFIQPVKSTSTINGGGLVPATKQLLPPFCPLVVTQTIIPSQPGLPVRFVSDTTTLITTSLPLNIEFNSSSFGPICKEYSKLWAVDDVSQPDKDPFIIIGGRLNSVFYIQKAQEANTYFFTSTTGGTTVGTIPGPWFGAPVLVATHDDSKTLLVKFYKYADHVATY